MEFNDYRAAHRELWDWLSKNPGKNKDDWPGWESVNTFSAEFKGKLIPFRCFMCAWYEHNGGCYMCPLDCNNRFGEYMAWERAMGYWEDEPNFTAACSIAAGIRDRWD